MGDPGHSFDRIVIAIKAVRHLSVAGARQEQLQAKFSVSGDQAGPRGREPTICRFLEHKRAETVLRF
ncbi:hypothetical protein XI03_15025 [Bradyrhizobium sp. CCBAU 65884]|nr:hypothetical protein [Bradyrhizobium sp. CCBAU 65884]